MESMQKVLYFTYNELCRIKARFILIKSSLLLKMVKEISTTEQPFHLGTLRKKESISFDACQYFSYLWLIKGTFDVCP
jgi:hypothetical protein